MTRHAPTGGIWRPSDGTGSEATYPSVFIQCVNSWEPMANKLWSHGLDDICRDVHPTAQVDIPPGTDK